MLYNLVLWSFLVSCERLAVLFYCAIDFNPICFKVILNTHFISDSRLKVFYYFRKVMIGMIISLLILIGNILSIALIVYYKNFDGAQYG